MCLYYSNCWSASKDVKPTLIETEETVYKVGYLETDKDTGVTNFRPYFRKFKYAANVVQPYVELELKKQYPYQNAYVGGSVVEEGYHAFLWAEKARMMAMACGNPMLKESTTIGVFRIPKGSPVYFDMDGELIVASQMYWTGETIK